MTIDTAMSRGDVRSALSAAARTMYEYFETKRSETSGACQYLMLKDDHPKLKRAIDEIKGKSSSEIDVLARDVATWESEARNSFRLDCDGMTAMWDAYCSVDFEDNESPEQSVAEQTAARLQSDMRSKMGPLLAQSASLQARAKTLSKRRTRDEAQRLLAVIDKHKERLQRLLPRDVWRGANDPLRFYAQEYGKVAHRQMENTYRCDVADKRFGGAGRPDCIVASSCELLEFKPNNPSAIKQGEDQQYRYKPAVEAFYTSFKQKKSDPPSEYGGESIMKKFQAGGCFKNGSLELEVPTPKTYNMCEKRWQCVEN